MLDFLPICTRLFDFLSRAGWRCLDYIDRLPGDERGVQGACRALQSFGAYSLCRRLPPLNLLFFLSLVLVTYCRRQLSLWRRFSCKTYEWVCRPVSPRPFDPFPDGNSSSLLCHMWCYALPSSSTNGILRFLLHFLYRRLTIFIPLYIIYRKDSNNLQNVGTAASKLLYTLHWTLLDAAEECADADREAGIIPREPFPYIFPLTCIRVLCSLSKRVIHFFIWFCLTFLLFSGICLPLRSAAPSTQRGWLAKLSAREWA